MTDKELHKLGRRELLQMLLVQAKEADRLAGLLAETEEQLHQLEDTYERLRDRLDKKDLQIRSLRETLEAERHKREIELEEAGSIAEAALRLNGVFEAAQKAADQYLESVRAMYPEEYLEDVRAMRTQQHASPPLEEEGPAQGEGPVTT